MKPSKQAIERARAVIYERMVRWTDYCGVKEYEDALDEIAEEVLTAAMEPVTLEEATGCDKPFGLIPLEDA